jgi:trk system potassium uptake protein
VINLYVIIRGGGQLGLKLAKKLITNGHNLTVIEKDEKRFSYLASKIDELILYKTATDKTTLKDIEISSADAFVATTDNDESNLLALTMARKLGAKKIIARLNEPQHESVFTSNDFLTVVTPETIKGYLEKLVLKPHVTGLFLIDYGRGKLLKININNPQIIGRIVEKLNLQEDYFVCGIGYKERLELKIANYDDLITENSIIVV